jgi:DNA (cytosine-5)-methyltransferase 1
MRVVSLFSGAGGLDLGFIQAGHEIIWANDFAKDAVETYRHNVGNHIVNCDISEVDAKKIPHCDIIIGGFPCQGFSLANLRRSVEDERNKLYLQFVRVLNEKKPAFFVAENVPGILSLDKGKVMEHIVDEFKSSGYTVKYKLHHAADYGTPQSRKRVFIVGVRSDIAKNFTYKFPKQTYRDNSKHIKKIDNKKIERFHNPHWRNYILSFSLPEVEKIDLQYNAGGALIELWKSVKYNHWVTISEVLRGIPEPEEPNNLLNHVGSKYKIVEKDFTGHRKTDPNKICPTLLARGNGKGGVVAIPHHKGHRRLTVRESARVQDFPDDFEFSGKLMSMYRQIGNAVPVNLARHIANQFPLIVPLSEEDISTTPTLVSLFSGCGGMDLGFIEAGFDVVWANEIFKGAVDTYRHNIGEHIVEKDIRNVNSNEVPNSTVIIGGFPCQGFSVANTGRNEDDERNGLYLEFVRLIKDKKPQIFVAENVKGILSLGKGEIFDMIKNDFTKVGYDVRHEVLLAADYGVPQKRKRVFIVGVRNDLDVDWSHFPPKKTHYDPQIGTLETDLEPWISVGIALSDIPDPDKKNSELNHTYSKFKLKFNGHLGNRYIEPDQPAPTVTGRGDYKGGVVVLHHPNNKRRMSVRELATIQDFPRDFEFTTAQSVSYVMIGNAVPRGMAKAVATSVKKLLLSAKAREVLAEEIQKSEKHYTQKKLIASM